jgi:hypothetical protein
MSRCYAGCQSECRCYPTTDRKVYHFPAATLVQDADDPTKFHAFNPGTTVPFDWMEMTSEAMERKS